MSPIMWESRNQGRTRLIVISDDRLQTETLALGASVTSPVVPRFNAIGLCRVKNEA